MEVIKSNFSEILPKIREAIDKCTFLSIDCELTGLNSAPNNINAFDSPKQYYEKVRKSCRDFLVIQYGLSIFRFDEESNKFKQQTYNFYIFRRPVERNIPDQRFLCQTSSIDFLINQGFDFNKLFKQGIPYLNIQEETKCKEDMEERRKRFLQMKSQKMDHILIPDNMQSFIDDVMTKIENYKNSDSTDDLHLPKCSAFHRRLIYQSVNEKYGNEINLETKQIDKERILVASKQKSDEEMEKLQMQKQEEMLRDLDDFVGFTKVLRIIVNSGKLVIGHNLCLDLLHSIDKFLTPLPEDFNEFKDCASSLFSKLIDTKYMSSIDPFKDLIASNVLSKLLETVNQPPFERPEVEIEDGCQGYEINDSKEHEAGYDAYITGLSFLSMWTFLGVNKKLSFKDIFSSHDLLRPFLNRIFLMKLTDNQYIYLGGKETTPSRNHVFHLTFPKDWKVSNITQLFSPFGNVQISWLDECSAYVALLKKDQNVNVVLNTLSQSDSYSIMTYAQRQALNNENNGQNQSNPQRRRKLSNSEFIANKKRRTSESSEPSKSEEIKEPEVGSDAGKEEEDEFTLVSSRGRKRGKKLAKTFSEATWE